MCIRDRVYTIIAYIGTGVNSTDCRNTEVSPHVGPEALAYVGTEVCTLFLVGTEVPPPARRGVSSKAGTEAVPPAATDLLLPPVVLYGSITDCHPCCAACKATTRYQVTTKQPTTDTRAILP